MDSMTGSATVTYHSVDIHHPFGDYGYAPVGVVLPSGTAVESSIFAAGGHYWSARFICHKVYGGGTCLSLGLHLWSKGVKVKACWELSVIDPIRGALPPTTLHTTPPQNFVASEHIAWDLDCALLRDPCSWYVDDNGCLVLEITVTVFPEYDPDPDPETTTMAKQIDDVVLPPSDLLDQLGEVLETREGADVTFSVAGELFPAHKIVLAMRSRVFRAQLYGEMKESGAGEQPIEVVDMTADTFRALLRYIYTDFSPARSSNQHEEEGCNEDDDSGHVWELLKAADLYSVERLKLICERILCKRLDVDNVADMLGLADQHHCGTLKDACIEFMTTSHSRMGQVTKSQGFLQLKHSHPQLLVEVLEKYV